MKHRNRAIALAVIAILFIILIFIIQKRMTEGKMASDSSQTQNPGQVFTAEDVSDQNENNDTSTDRSSIETSSTVATVIVSEEYEIELGETESIDGF